MQKKYVRKRCLSIVLMWGYILSRFISFTLSLSSVGHLGGDFAAVSSIACFRS